MEWNIMDNRDAVSRFIYYDIPSVHTKLPNRKANLLNILFPCTLNDIDLVDFE